MEKLTQKELKRLALYGAKDITNLDDIKIMELINNNKLTSIGYASGIYGLNGLLIQNDDTKELYVITKRTTNLFRF